jgi:hypothetical protein
MRKFSAIMALITCFSGSHLPVAATIDVNTADQTKIIPTIQIIQPSPNDSALRLEARQAPWLPTNLSRVPTDFQNKKQLHRE